MVSHDIRAAIKYAGKILHIEREPVFFGTKDDYIKELHVELPLEAASPELRTALAKECRRHKGKARLYVDLTFEHDGIEDTLSLFSKKFSLSPDYELLAFLDKKNLRHHLVTKVEL